MTAFVQLGIAAIAAFTLLAVTTIVMQAKREAIASSTRVGRDMAKAISSHTNPEEDE